MPVSEIVVSTIRNAITIALIFVLIGIQLIQSRLLETCTADGCALTRRLQTPEVVILAALAVLVASEFYRQSKRK